MTRMSLATSRHYLISAAKEGHSVSTWLVCRQATKVRVGWSSPLIQVSSPPPSCATSLHPPLPLWLPAGRLVLELLPLPRRLVDLPMDHVRVNLLRRPYRSMSQPRGHRRQWHAAGQQVRAVRVPQGVEARALWQLQAGISDSAQGV